ncbi:purine-cytosine permease family protein [Actinomadura violacea]|uniref:Cytosine permease n=1 Tax=Actinomadura violacea TaxID=2819934 RepID=A0ABS3RNA5_9ACTN|nr:cytosine permease [Actinomadura violacea]MBO2458186.1 cytosine permease [Actinomadura violacea]
MSQKKPVAIEQHSIDQIPESERHTKPWSLTTLWFANNVGVVVAVNGALAVFSGLSLAWAIFSIVVGNLVGGLFMAYHSVQGARLGIPQMIQSRAQFGSLGAVLPMSVAVLIYAGFAITGGVVGGQAIAALLGLPDVAGVVGFNVVVMVIALIGHDLIHRVAKIATVVAGAMFIALTIKLLVHAGSVQVGGGEVTWQKVLMVMSIAASWQITWSPYVSDYSRYLPSGTSARRTFWFTYAGSCGGAIWVMSVGALAAAIAGAKFGTNPIGFFSDQFPALSKIIVAVFLLGTLTGGAQGPYGAFLAAYGAVAERGAVAGAATRVRASFVVAFSIIVTICGLAASSHLLDTMESILLFILYTLTPWTAINLTDYFLVRKGSYDVAALFQRRGLYGVCNWPVVTLYLATIALEVPFINTKLYQGPISPELGGADLAWIVGLIVPAVGYYLIARRTRSSPAEPLTEVRTPMRPNLKEAN